MNFTPDWEDFLKKVDEGAALSPEEEKCARAVKALRTSGNVRPADPAFLENLMGRLRDEYRATYETVSSVSASGSRWFSFAFPRLAFLGAAACAVIVPAVVFLAHAPKDALMATERPGVVASSPSANTASDGWSQKVADAFKPSSPQINYGDGRILDGISLKGENFALDGSLETVNMVAGASAGILGGSGDYSLSAAWSRSYAVKAFFGFLCLAVAAYGALGAFFLVAGIWRGRREISAVGLAARTVLLVLTLSVAAAATLAVLFFLASVRTDFSLGNVAFLGDGFLDALVFALTFAAAGSAVFSAVSAAVRDGSKAFPRLAMTLAAAPSLPSIIMYLGSAHPSSALANFSFLALNALAVAASAWPRPGMGSRLDRAMAALSVLVVSFPLYAYFLQPRAATSPEIVLWCVFVSGWAAVTAVPLLRRMKSA